MRAGVSFGDWRAMSRWQVQDLALRHKAATEGIMKTISSSPDKDKLSAMISAVVSRILGV